MVLNITCHAIKLSKRVRNNIKHQLENCLEHFSCKVHSARVTFKDVNGPRGGSDKECTICVKPVGASHIVIKSRAEKSFQAFAMAKVRLKNVLRKRPVSWKSVSSKKVREIPVEGLMPEETLAS